MFTVRHLPPKTPENAAETGVTLYSQKQQNKPFFLINVYNIIKIMGARVGFLV